MLFVRLITIHLSFFTFLNLLHKNFIIAHFRHHILSFFPSVNQNIYSLIKFIQVNLHIFLLRLKILWLLVRVKLVQRGGPVVDNIRILWLAAIRSSIFIVLLVLFALFLELLGPFMRVSVPLLHEPQSPFLRSSFNILRSLREQVTKRDQSGLVNA